MDTPYAFIPTVIEDVKVLTVPPDVVVSSTAEGDVRASVHSSVEYHSQIVGPRL
jgi:hypothetical protein